MARAIAARGKVRGRPSEPEEAGAQLRASFVAALLADYRAHGPATIAALRTEKPVDYLKLVASLLPKPALAEEGSGNGAVPIAVEVHFVDPVDPEG